ncbi:MAG: ABC transporter permease subunit [Pseudonocardiaceae bacterium]|nr:ABC transporter permease subunit [Pseudonocardiaceae bacterium]
MGTPNVFGGMGGLVWFVVVALPIYWMVITSLKSQDGFLASNPLVPPSDPTLDNYGLVLSSGFPQYLLNSAIVTVAAVGLTVLTALMAAYVIVQSTGKLTQTVFRIFLAGLAIPVHATIIPIYFIITRLQLYDTLIALVLPTVAFGLPITVLILSNFLRDVPSELFDAMRIDGASEWQMLWRLVAPLSRPALITVIIYNSLQVWNGFLFPLILTQSPSTRVVSLGLWSFQGEFTINVPAILAAVVLSALPVLALYIGGRRQLVSGLTAGFTR